ncbi:hypothetical protein [Desulfovibrio sp. ZJ200]|uniref:hypothetical protein n=1 Tax=Desulfovibrio sp. ZJ200 TaxID=2709792 RepID=UPI00197E837A|nr:hypothetical protein [Desulfovibrio sp. ZJ200]
MRDVQQLSGCDRAPGVFHSRCQELSQEQSTFETLCVSKVHLPKNALIVAVDAALEHCKGKTP